MIDPGQLPAPASPPVIETPASTGTAPAPAKPNLQNRFVARAVLYNETANAQAQRLAVATSQPPANSTDLAAKPGELAQAWHFSPSQSPAADFWQMHDDTLAQNLAKVPPGSPPDIFHAAHSDAESKALNAVYPYRAELIGQGTRQLEDQVAQAARIKRLVEGPSATAADVLPSAAPPPPAPVAPPPPPPMAMPPVIAPPAAQPGPPMLNPAGGPV